MEKEDGEKSTNLSRLHWGRGAPICNLLVPYCVTYGISICHKLHMSPPHLSQLTYGALHMAHPHMGIAGTYSTDKTHIWATPDYIWVSMSQHANCRTLTWLACSTRLHVLCFYTIPLQLSLVIGHGWCAKTETFKETTEMRRFHTRKNNKHATKLLSFCVTGCLLKVLYPTNLNLSPKKHHGRYCIVPSVIQRYSEANGSHM